MPRAVVHHDDAMGVPGPRMTPIGHHEPSGKDSVRRAHHHRSKRSQALRAWSPQLFCLLPWITIWLLPSRAAQRSHWRCLRNMPPSNSSQRPPLLSRSEQHTERVLQEVAGHHAYRIFSQVKLSQVIRERPPGVTDKQWWQYGTRATFDFVVADAATTRPEFAVEFDDSSHWRPEVQERDRIKDLICDQAGFELLRIESHHLPVGLLGRRLVEYLIEARAYCLNIGELQAEGYLPADELFDYGGVVGGIADGYLNLPNDLASSAHRAVRKAYEQGRVLDIAISTQSFNWRSGWCEGWAWVRARDDLFLFASTQVRSYPTFYCGIPPFELAQDLSTAAIEEQLAAYGRNEPVLVRASDIGERFAGVRARRDELLDTSLVDHITMFGR